MASSGMMFAAVPALNWPIVRTQAFEGSLSLAISSCKARWTWTPMFIGSTPTWGYAPWEPFPFMIILNPSTEYIIVSFELYINIPTGIFPGETWYASAASGFGASSMPFSIIFLLPSNVSSAGWNINLTVPSSISSFSFNIFAAVRSIAAWKSWPQVCAAFPVGQANSSPLCSGIGSASISARSKSTFPPPFPKTAVIPYPHSLGSMPYSLSFSITNVFVTGISRPVSACSCI